MFSIRSLLTLDLLEIVTRLGDQQRVKAQSRHSMDLKHFPVTCVVDSLYNFPEHLTKCAVIDAGPLMADFWRTIRTYWHLIFHTVLIIELTIRWFMPGYMPAKSLWALKLRLIMLDPFERWLNRDIYCRRQMSELKAQTTWVYTLMKPCSVPNLNFCCFDATWQIYAPHFRFQTQYVT